MKKNFFENMRDTFNSRDADWGSKASYWAGMGIIAAGTALMVFGGPLALGGSVALGALDIALHNAYGVQLILGGALLIGKGILRTAGRAPTTEMEEGNNVNASKQAPS